MHVVPHETGAGVPKSEMLLLPELGIRSAVEVRIDSIWAGVRLGFFCSRSAAADVTCGVAWLVPPT